MHRVVPVGKINDDFNGAGFAPVSTISQMFIRIYEVSTYNIGMLVSI